MNNINNKRTLSNLEMSSPQLQFHSWSSFFINEMSDDPYVTEYLSGAQSP